MHLNLNRTTSANLQTTEETNTWHLKWNEATTQFYFQMWLCSKFWCVITDFTFERASEKQLLKKWFKVEFFVTNEWFAQQYVIIKKKFLNVKERAMLQDVNLRFRKHCQLGLLLKWYEDNFVSHWKEKITSELIA